MEELYSVFLVGLSILLSIQGVFNLFLLLYAWEDPDQLERNRSPRRYIKPRFSFTALLPARHEEAVIAHTIHTVSEINYPDEMKEILVICRSDDTGTIAEAQKAIDEIGKSNVRLVIFNGFPINKPHGLNLGLQEATKDVVVIFDAEDEPHKDIYNIVNTVMIRDSADVVQSGVQLMNYQSSWFSAPNVLEYFFWFKSALQFFARHGIVPLGGNTVFFRKECLERIGGWDEQCLTEDADLGIRLSAQGAKIRVVYDEQHVTKEETPPDITSFIKQRTRWNQGFMQVLLKEDWMRLPGLKQKLLALYVLVWPEVQSFLFLYMPFSLIFAISIKLPPWIVLLSSIPMYLLILQLLTSMIGLYEFTRYYKLKFSWFMLVKLLLVYFPYQFILGLSALRAGLRFAMKNTHWEKTAHTNAHREERVVNIVPQLAVETV